MRGAGQRHPLKNTPRTSISGEESAPETAASAAAVAKVVAAGLSFEDATPAERLAVAIWDVRSGRASVGLAALEALIAEDQAGELSVRIERERGRVAAWIELRDAFLQKCLDEEIQLQFEYRPTLVECLGQLIAIRIAEHDQLIAIRIAEHDPFEGIGGLAKQAVREVVLADVELCVVGAV